jgi:prepilin-type N-terminal cleavage/methylation domain-containing protein
LLDQVHMASRAGGEGGFSLTELMLTVAVMGTIMAMAVPVMTDMSATAKLNEAVRTVEREFQGARLKAVSSNRVLRVRTNCPATGYIRTVEVLGTADDTASNRCLQSAFPFPPPDTELTTRPNLDGPVRVLPNTATVGSVVLQFIPDACHQRPADDHHDPGDRYRDAPGQIPIDDGERHWQNSAPVTAGSASSKSSSRWGC